MIHLAKFKYVWLCILLLETTVKGIAQCTSFEDSICIVKGNMQPQQIINKINSHSLAFRKLTNNRINFGIVGNGYVFLLIKLSSTCQMEDLYLSIDNTSIDTVSIYKIEGEEHKRLLYQGGNSIAFETKRNFVWHTTPVEINTYPSFYLVALKAPQKNINIRYEIISKDKLYRKYLDYNIIVFLYIGIVLLISVIIVVAFFLFKKRVFVAYLGYILCLCGWILSHYGFAFPFLYPRIPGINEIVKPVASLGACLFLITVLHFVFNEQLQHIKWLRQAIKWMRYVLLVMTTLMFLFLISTISGKLKAGLIASWHISLIFSICIIIITPFCLIKYDFTARIFSFAMLIICIMALVQLLANAGYISNFFLSEHGMTMGSLLEIIVIALGISYSFLEEKRFKEYQLRKLEQVQTETLKRLITVQDNERKRIAGDLHDNIGPLLAALKINFRRIIHTKEKERQQDELIAKTESIINDSITEIRNVAHNLMPKGLSLNGLINTLAEYFGNIQQLYGITIMFNHQIHSIFHPDLQINIYRIVCELVLNAARHSNSSIIIVRTVSDERGIYIFIQDEGQGFQPKHLNQKKSLGLQSIESRVLYLKGKFTLKTEPAKGTIIDIEIPLQFNETNIDGL